METLPQPARYVPLDKGIYEVAPGLYPLGFDFGNKSSDQKIIQIDQEFSTFQTNRRACRDENFSKYFQEKNLPRPVRKRAIQFLISQLCNEWPQYFSLQTSHDSQSLVCKLTSETLVFDLQGELVHPKHYNSTLDALISQIQEDVAIVVNEGESDKIGMLYVCGPSHWAPEQKIGLNFNDVHSPVPGFEKMAKVSRSLVQAMVNKGPFVRFVWSFVTDRNLNHHPVAPKDQDPVLWKGRAFNSAAKIPFYLRVERQVTVGLPEVNAALFFIRLSFVDGVEIRKHPLWRANLISALHSMSPESRRYKGVEQCFDDLVAWLEDA